MGILMQTKSPLKNSFFTVCWYLLMAVITLSRCDCSMREMQEAGALGVAGGEESSDWPTRRLSYKIATKKLKS